MARNPDLIDFEVLWYNGGPGYAPNRCIGRTIVRKRTLSEAIKRACRILIKPGKNDSAAMAHGFYVREYNPDRRDYRQH